MIKIINNNYKDVNHKGTYNNNMVFNFSTVLIFETFHLLLPPLIPDQLLLELSIDKKNHHYMYIVLH